MQSTVMALIDSVKADQANALKSQQEQNEMVKQRMIYMAEQANKTEERMRAAQESRDQFAAEERMLMQEQFRQQQERDDNARREQQQAH